MIAIDQDHAQGIARLLRELRADIVGIQELEDRHHAGMRVSDYLAGRLDMHAYRGPTLQRGTADYGNLLLAKHPADEIRTMAFTDSNREPRGAIEATFSLGAERIHVVTTHLCLSARERAKQLDAILARLRKSRASATILLGDFNEWRRFSFVDRRLREHFGKQRNGPTFPALRPLIRLDRVLVDPESAISGSGIARSALAANASDHLPVYTDLMIRSG